MTSDSRANVRPLVAGIIGWPVYQSKSPLIHRHWLKQTAIDGDYIRFAVAPGNAAQALRSMTALNIIGLQATMPHKQDCYHAVDLLTSEAKQLGAVNTIVPQADGTLLGHNTDMEGFLEPLLPIDLSGQSLTVFGAGGAAAAIIVGLAAKKPAQINIVNRSIATIDKMLAHIGSSLDGVEIKCCQWDQRETVLADAALIVNATSLGMADNPPLLIDLAALGQNSIVYDIVTNPVATPLLRSARGRGLRCFDGIDMLIGQARSAFALFYGVSAPQDQDETLKALLRAC